MRSRGRSGFKTPSELTTILAWLHEHTDAIEADLSRYHRLDLRDLHRRGEDGRRLLTTRMVWARVKHLPADSALAVELNGGAAVWELGHHLLADLFHATARIPHPAKPAPAEGRRRDSERERRLLAARRRAREHRAERDKEG